MYTVQKITRGPTLESQFTSLIVPELMLDIFHDKINRGWPPCGTLYPQAEKNDKNILLFFCHEKKLENQACETIEVSPGNL